MSGFKFGTGNQNTGQCDRMGCYADSKIAIQFRGITYFVCKRHGK